MKQLTYRVEHSKAHAYKQDASFEGTLGPFSVRIEEGRANFVPLQHFGSESEARSILDPLVDGWNLDALVVMGPGSFRLKFVSSHVIEAEPPPGVVLVVASAHIAITSGKANLLLTHATYHPPPTDMVGNALTAELSSRYAAIVQHPESLLMHGYAVLSRLEYEYGNRSDVATALNVHPQVLSALGRLTSEKGEGNDVRKFIRGKTPTPLTSAEREWIVNTIRELTRRVAQEAAGKVPATRYSDQP